VLATLTFLPREKGHVDEKRKGRETGLPDPFLPASFTRNRRRKRPKEGSARSTYFSLFLTGGGIGERGGRGGGGRRDYFINIFSFLTATEREGRKNMREKKSRRLFLASLPLLHHHCEMEKGKASEGGGTLNYSIYKHRAEKFGGKGRKVNGSAETSSPLSARR